MLALVVGCKDPAPPPATPEPSTITVTDAAGEVLLTARITGSTCEIGGGLDLAVTRTEAGAKATAAEQTLEVGPGRVPESRDLTGSAIAPIRIHRVNGPPVRADFLDEIGVPIARLQVDLDEARVSDASRALVATVTPRAGKVTATAGAAPERGPAGHYLGVGSGGAPLGEVTGPVDLETATILIAPGLPPAARALLACERLLAGTAVPR